MKFRLKITLCMIWLLSLSFGIGGSLMIGSSFSSALSQEKAAAEDSYRFLIRTIEMVNSISTLPNTSDIAGILKEMDSMGMTNFDALRLLSGDEIAYTVQELRTEGLLQHLTACIGSHDDDGVLEVYHTTLIVGQTAIVQYLK